MIRNIHMACAALVTAACLVGAASMQADVEFDDRLAGLDPSNPRAYFELAEDVADAPATDDDRELARRLFALAAVLDSRTFGRSACLALASMEDDANAKRRLRALASLLDASRFSSMPATGFEVDRRAEPTSAAIIGATEALGRYRNGQGALALTAAREPGVMEVLESANAAIPGGVARFLEDCKLYRGQVKPSLSEDEVNALLRLEAALLAGAYRSWSGELLMSGGQPLVEVDPDRLEESLGIDATRTVFRDGRWVRP